MTWLATAPMRITSLMMPALFAVACTGRDGKATRGATAAATVSASAPARQNGSPADWFATADSVMRVHVQRMRYTAPDGYARSMRECAGEEASDNPPFAIAAARTRVLDHDTLALYNMAEYGVSDAPMKQTSFRVEVTSAAYFIPNWIAKVPNDNTVVPFDEAYVAEVGPRVDTVEIVLDDLGDRDPRWGVCAPTYGGDAAGFQYWSFLRESRRWLKPIQWKPADATWERIRALADSLTGR